MRTVIYGTKGTIICDNTSDHLKLYTTDEPTADGTYKYTKPQIIQVDVNNHNATAEIKAFVDALINNKPAPVSSIEGASTVAVCCRTVESANENKTLKIEYPTV